MLPSRSETGTADFDSDVRHFCRPSSGLRRLDYYRGAGHECFGAIRRFHSDSGEIRRIGRNTFRPWNGGTGGGGYRAIPGLTRTHPLLAYSSIFLFFCRAYLGVVGPYFLLSTHAPRRSPSSSIQEEVTHPPARPQKMLGLLVLVILHFLLWMPCIPKMRPSVSNNDLYPFTIIVFSPTITMSCIRHPAFLFLFVSLHAAFRDLPSFCYPYRILTVVPFPP